MEPVQKFTDQLISVTSYALFHRNDATALVPSCLSLSHLLHLLPVLFLPLPGSPRLPVAGAHITQLEGGVADWRSRYNHGVVMRSSLDHT